MSVAYDGPAAGGDPWAGYQWPRKDADGRTNQPIRHGSRPSLGANEPARRISAKQRDGWLRAFDRHAKAARPNGVRRGHMKTIMTLSHAARPLYAYFLDLAVATGRVMPSYQHIAEVLDIPRSLVGRIIAQLEALGWIRKERRFREAKTAGQEGPQLEQDTNWYTVELPIAAAKLLKAWQRKDLEDEASPPPADEIAAKERRRARETLARGRRAAEQNLRRVREFLAAATDPRSRRKLQESIDQLQVQIADTLRREAALSETNAPRRSTEAAALLNRARPMTGQNPPSERI
jgi:hypothetical protein